MGWLYAFLSTCCCGVSGGPSRHKLKMPLIKRSFSWPASNLKQSAYKLWRNVLQVRTIHGRCTQMFSSRLLQPQGMVEMEQRQLMACWQVFSSCLSGLRSYIALHFLAWLTNITGKTLYIISFDYSFVHVLLEYYMPYTWDCRLIIATGNS